MALQRLAGRVCSLRVLFDGAGQHVAPSQLSSLCPPSQQAASSTSHVQPLSALVSLTTHAYCAQSGKQPDLLAERAASSMGTSTSSRSSSAASRPQGSSSPDKAAVQPSQQPKPQHPFHGTRRPPSLRPHAGGPTPDQVSAALGPPQVVRLGKVGGAFRVPRKAVFAVVELGPTQFKVRGSSIRCLQRPGASCTLSHACTGAPRMAATSALQASLFSGADGDSGCHGTVLMCAYGS